MNSPKQPIKNETHFFVHMHLWSRHKVTTVTVSYCTHIIWNITRHIFTDYIPVQKNYTGTVRCGSRELEMFGGENTALNRVLFLICLSLQETLQALCCKVSASCCCCFSLSHSLLPFSPPSFPPPAVWVIEFIPCGKRTTSGPRHTSCCQLGSYATPLTAVSHKGCSLIQGKCQTQETVLKYLYVQRFFSCNNLFHPHRAREQLSSAAKTNSGNEMYSRYVCKLCMYLTWNSRCQQRVGVDSDLTAERCLMSDIVNMLCVRILTLSLSLHD